MDNTHFGDGLHRATLSRERYFNTQELSIVASITYQAAIPTIKATFLLQYRRMFPLPIFQRLCDIFLAFVIAFGISQMVSVPLFCIPLRSLWDTTVPGQCIDRLLWWFIGSSVNLTTDVVIIAMPLPLLRNIQMPLRQKAMLLATFTLGFLTCAISVVRITTLRESNMEDATWDTVIAGVWSIIELSCAMICVCAPTFRPLLIRQKTRMKSPTWLRPEIEVSDNTSGFSQSDGGVLSQNRRSEARSGMQRAVDQADEEPARSSNVLSRSRLQLQLNNIPSLPFPPAALLTSSENSSLQSSPETMVPWTRFDIEEGVDFSNADMSEPELPTPLQPPPWRHTGITIRPEDDGYFRGVVWDASGQRRVLESSGSV
ncbi:putative integral membrane protein [Colletotrichum sublineola]|uniref:Putative integral membrane protein n=1 Tax=Colletotrichum sublineola TaxID=1173701 RepID=A0A066XP79_COLSU|nr:putative integral membrane protein [Colletotrichum sublineola]